MSYILEAIRKAEQKRKLGAVPDVGTVHEVPMVDPRRPAWVYGLAVILLVNAGLIGWWLWSSRGKTPAAKSPAAVAQSAAPSGKGGAPVPTASAPGQGDSVPGAVVFPPAGQSAPAGPQAAPPPATPAQASVKPASPPVFPPPAGPSAVTRGAGTTAASGGSALPAATLQPKPGLPLPAKQAGAPPSASPQNPAAGARVVPVVEKEPAPAPEEERRAAEGQEEPIAFPEAEEAPKTEEGVTETGDAEPRTLTPIAVSKPPAKGKKAESKESEDLELAKIPLWKQLPVEVQQSVPEIRLSFHSYSFQSASRLVSIGGKVLREGQELEPGVRLETITPKGVVVDAKGRRFRVNMD